MFYCSISQMVVDTICVVRSQNTNECLNQDVLFLGTSESTVAVFVGGGGGGGWKDWGDWGDEKCTNVGWVSFTRYIYFAGNGRILKVVFATNGTQTSPVFSEDIAVSVVVAMYVCMYT